MQLVIVESPKKAKTIGKILGRSYRVEASYGHVRDLPPKELGVAVDNGFAPTWVPVPKARTRLAALRKIAATADVVLLATDPDREGEAIAWHVADALKVRRPVRVVFHAITSDAVRAAFQRPREIDRKLVDAQQARRLLDRLVGYQVSPLLWRKIARGTSAGRVQSVALRLVVERERAVRGFAPVEYWTIDALVNPNDRPSAGFSARLAKVDGVPIAIPSRDVSEELTADLKTATYRVAAQSTTEVARHPPPPFTTSTLQQAAASRLRLSGKRTMQLAQSLYEAGAITYHRTDAVRVEPEAIEAARAVIAARFGAGSLPARPRQYANRVKNAQEAHEAIRPVDPRLDPDQPNALPTDERALYRLIWQRFVASQMAAARYRRQTVDVAAQSVRAYILRAGATTLTSPGYLAVYGTAADETEPNLAGGEDAAERLEARNAQLPAVRDGDPLTLDRLTAAQHFTQPPPRFSEAALIRELERAGVGRPSTYATIVGTIQERGYVERERRDFVPTELGFAVNDFVVRFFPSVADLGFTAELEDGLDQVARGERGWLELLQGFYGPFLGALDAAGRSAVGPVSPAATHEGTRRRAGAGRTRRAPPDPLTKRVVARGAKRPPAEAAKAEPIGELCPLCGREMRRRIGPYSEFLGCSGFPTCKGTVPLERPPGARTPKGAVRRGMSRSRRRSRGQ